MKPTAGQNHYRIISDDDDLGPFRTAREAHRAAAKAGLDEYEMWLNGFKMPGRHVGYSGDDDRARQGLGLPNASEA